VSPTTKQTKLAEKVGRLLGERGAILVCGSRGGIMEAACRCAQHAGGITVGILPGEDARGGNAYLTLALPTGLGHARNVLVTLAGDAIIAIGGGYGTLSEIGIALKRSQLVIGLDTWEAQRSDGEKAQIIHAETPEEAVEMALAGRKGKV
jgi:uncharacterized protein (TIGR00725 family)